MNNNSEFLAKFNNGPVAIGRLTEHELKLAVSLTFTGELLPIVDNHIVSAFELPSDKQSQFGGPGTEKLGKAFSSGVF